MQKPWKMTGTLEPSESNQRELSNGYRHDRAWIVFKDRYVHVLWAKVAIALKGLTITWESGIILQLFDAELLIVISLTFLMQLFQQLCFHPNEIPWNYRTTFQRIQELFWVQYVSRREVPEPADRRLQTRRMPLWNAWDCFITENLVLPVMYNSVHSVLVKQHGYIQWTNCTKNTLLEN